MESLINAVKKAIKTKNWFAALFMVLTLPDICGAMEHPNMKSGERYKKWYKKYISHKYSKLTANNCWLLRNACLHEGSDSNVKMAFKRIHFIEKGKGMVIHNNVINNVLQLQVDEFCIDICKGVENWLSDTRGNKNILSRTTALMKIHPISSIPALIKF